MSDLSIAGMSASTFTQLHVLISLVALVTGFVTVVGMMRSQLLTHWNQVFLITTIATSATGFMFHSPFGPAHVIGMISLLVLAIAVAALYVFKLRGRWSWIYSATATSALYLNFFVAVVQAFQKVPFLYAIAPTQAAPPFAIAQGIVLLGFVGLGILAARNFVARPLASIAA
jgi:uncharacterized membrane protein